ncbi:MAG: adenosine deaminase [Armatimonadetes bacterium]|nr:adenosine deaminase [Armatimonadota bacterium]
MLWDEFIEQMPKVELHVHLEGSIRPETLLKLARRNGIELPADDLDGLKKWYAFRDFPHFAEIYWTIGRCLRTADDIELIAREFLVGQKAQNVLHSEVTYTALTQFKQCNIAFDDQLAALNRARRWGVSELGASMAVVMDIPRDRATVEEGEMVGAWAAEGFGQGIDAIGLGGYEVGYPPEMFKSGFDLARKAGVPSVPHAGETEGPSSIWGAINELGAIRLGHGIRCLEDRELVDTLREKGITLEVCPSSNVCLNVVPSWEEHPLPQLLSEGLRVTINSDDPPMFSTTLTDEWKQAQKTFDLDRATVETLTLNAVDACFLPPDKKAALRETVVAQLSVLAIA